jgi:hypothetical protein
VTKPHLSREACRSCGGALTVHEEARGGFCAKPACRHASLRRGIALLQRDIARREEAAAAVLKQRVAEACVTIIPSLGLAGPESPAVATVPATSKSVVKLPRRRKSQFRRQLASIVAESVKQSAASPAPSLPEEELPAAAQFGEETPAMRDGCATCRGHCCRLGADRNAFLDALTLRRYMTAEPGQRPRDIIRAYVDRIPELSVAGSCVFHGAAGCTLPRRMRAAICNGYHCDGLKQIQGLLEDTRIRKILIVATTETDVVRWNVHDRMGDPGGPAGRSTGGEGAAG